MPLQFAHSRLLHTMLRVADLDRSLAFYVGQLGMRLLRRADHPQGHFTLAFLGYGEEHEATALELTHNWEATSYLHGTAYGHIAIAVPDLMSACEALSMAGVPVVRPPGPLRDVPGESIAFIEDPDGYRIELIQQATTQSGP